MIDKEILDAVLPLPTLDELKEQKVEELKDEASSSATSIRAACSTRCS